MVAASKLLLDARAIDNEGPAVRHTLERQWIR